MKKRLMLVVMASLCSAVAAGVPQAAPGELIVEATLPPFTSFDGMMDDPGLGDGEKIILMSVYLPLMMQQKEGEAVKDLDLPHAASVKGLAAIEGLLFESQKDSHLPAKYQSFYQSLKDKGPHAGADSMKALSKKGDPIHAQISWQATEIGGKNTVDLLWEIEPLGDKLISVKLKASSSDASVNLRALEDVWLSDLLKNPGIKLISSGR